MRKMVDFDGVTKENIKEHNRNWRGIPDYPSRILILEILDLGKQIIKSP